MAGRVGFVGPERVPWALWGVAAVITAVSFAEAAVRVAADTPELLLTPNYLVSFGVTLPFVAGIAYGARYLGTEPFPVERNRRILGWCVAVTLLWLGINLLTLLVLGFTSPLVVVAWVRGTVAFGVGVGLVVGIMEARAVTQAVAAEQARLQAEHTARQRDLVDYVNSLLRHEVLNGINVIAGHAQLLAETDGDHATHVDPILRRSDEIQSVIREVRTVVESVDAETDPEPTELATVVRQEAAKARDLDPDATVDLSVPEGVSVYGHGTVGLVVGNLLSNAVEHGGDAPHVRVSADTDETHVTLRIADDGPGIAPEMREGLFERPESGTGDHGYGLYLVAVLCRQIDGDVTLTETGADGTAFEVTLRRADTDNSGGTTPTEGGHTTASVR